MYPLQFARKSGVEWPWLGWAVWVYETGPRSAKNATALTEALYY